jgi:hypothetical protein
MRIAIPIAVTCLSIVGVTATAQVHAAIRQHTEIPAEPLDWALRTLAKDRGIQLVYLTENVAELRTRGPRTPEPSISFLIKSDDIPAKLPWSPLDR